MQTVTEFKRFLKPGMEVDSALYWYDREGNPYLKRDYGVRKIGKVRSTSFAMLTNNDGKEVLSYADFPKKEDFEVLADGIVRIGFDGGFLIYMFYPES